jgi:hypothetical protein
MSHIVQQVRSIAIDAKIVAVLGDHLQLLKHIVGCEWPGKELDVMRNLCFQQGTGFCNCVQQFMTEATAADANKD